MNGKKTLRPFLLVVMLIGGIFPAINYLKTYHSVLPLKLTPSSLPSIDITIEGKRYPIALDFGSRMQVKLYENILGDLEKVPYKKEEWKNFRGVCFEAPTFLIPKINIGSLCLKKPVVLSFPKALEREYVIWEDSSRQSNRTEKVGTLGQGLLKKLSILIDVNQEKTIFSNSFKKLKQEGYNINEFIKIPMEVTSKGAFVYFETDLGKLKLFLDTGSTLTILHNSLIPKDRPQKNTRYGLDVVKSKTFACKGIDFGEKDLYFIQMGNNLKICDGILGMDFFKKHVVYIDFPNKTMYVKKPA